MTQGCKTCVFADWQRTDKGNINSRVAGRCTKPPLHTSPTGCQIATACSSCVQQSGQTAVRNARRTRPPTNWQTHQRNRKPSRFMLGFSFTGADMSEHKIQNEGRNALAQPGIFNTRANVGKAWTGSECTKLPNGDMLIKNPRPFDTGLPPGFTDTFGVTSEVITQEMVGRAIGVAHFIEYKTDTGRASPKQSAFIRAMNRLGARAGVARSAAEAVTIAKGQQQCTLCGGTGHTPTYCPWGAA